MNRNRLVGIFDGNGQPRRMPPKMAGEAILVSAEDIGTEAVPLVDQAQAYLETEGAARAAIEAGGALQDIAIAAGTAAAKNFPGDPDLAAAAAAKAIDGAVPPPRAADVPLTEATAAPETIAAMAEAMPYVPGPTGPAVPLGVRNLSGWVSNPFGDDGQRAQFMQQVAHPAGGRIAALGQRAGLDHDLALHGEQGLVYGTGAALLLKAIHDLNQGDPYYG